MKKLFSLGLALLLSVAVVGCSSSGQAEKSSTGDDVESTDNQNNDAATNDDDTQKEETQKPEQETQDSKYPFPDTTKEKGKGKIVVETPAGSSENGNVPVLFVDADTALNQIGLNATNFDGSKQTFIFVNKVFVETNQFGSRSSTSLTLQGNLLKPGKYTVSAIQFKNNDPESGKVVAFATAKYEIKQGK